MSRRFSKSHPLPPEPVCAISSAISPRITPLSFAIFEARLVRRLVESEAGFLSPAWTLRVPDALQYPQAYLDEKPRKRLHEQSGTPLAVIRRIAATTR
jgi:hypothetical protein